MKIYSAYLTFSPISEECLQAISGYARSLSIGIDLSSTSLEFEYSGRDAGRRVQRFLIIAARELVDSNGEVECRIIDDENNDRFEYFRIQNQRLYVTPARIIRGEERLIDADIELGAEKREDS